MIKCSDKASIAFDSLWHGSQVKVGCIQRLWQKLAGKQTVLSRDPVLGSVIAQDADLNTIEIKDIKGRQVNLAQTLNDGFVSYCPWLDMRVVDVSFETDEWGMKVSWQLVLEES